MGGDGDPVTAFIERWRDREGGAERANYALFLIGLCRILGVPEPDPATASTELNDYVFERAVRFRDAGTGRIDLYKRGCFILEAKQSRWKGGAKEIAGQEDLFEPEAQGAALGRRGAERAWDVLMLNAAGRRRTTPARFRLRTTGPPSSSSATSATSSRSMPTSPARGATTRSSPIDKVFASTSKTFAARRFGSACG
jgi:hypothetical protein